MWNNSQFPVLFPVFPDQIKFLSIYLISQIVGIRKFPKNPFYVLKYTTNNSLVQKIISKLITNCCNLKIVFHSENKSKKNQDSSTYRNIYLTIVIIHIHKIKIEISCSFYQKKWSFLVKCKRKAKKCHFLKYSKKS